LAFILADKVPGTFNVLHLHLSEEVNVVPQWIENMCMVVEDDT
jgi:hypothetical protein